MIWRRKIERFIESVKDLQELITEFDEGLWAGLVDSMTVHRKDRIVFGLRAGWRLRCKQKWIALLDYDDLTGLDALWQVTQMIDQITDKGLCCYGELIPVP